MPGRRHWCRHGNGPPNDVTSAAGRVQRASSLGGAPGRGGESGGSEREEERGAADQRRRTAPSDARAACAGISMIGRAKARRTGAVNWMDGPERHNGAASAADRAASQRPLLARDDPPSRIICM